MVEQAPMQTCVSALGKVTIGRGWTVKTKGNGNTYDVSQITSDSKNNTTCSGTSKMIR